MVADVPDRKVIFWVDEDELLDKEEAHNLDRFLFVLGMFLQSWKSRASVTDRSEGDKRFAADRNAAKLQSHLKHGDAAVPHQEDLVNCLKSQLVLDFAIKEINAASENYVGARGGIWIRGKARSR